MKGLSFSMWYYSYPKTDALTNLPYYIVSIGQHELQPYTAKPTGHAFDQFFYSTEGDGYLSIYNKTLEVPAGSAFFLPAFVPHKYYPKGEVWDLRWVSCAGSGLASLYKLIGLETGKIYSVRSFSVLDSLLKRMHHELVLDAELGNYFASAYLNQFIMEFARECGLLQPKKAQTPLTDVYQQNMSVLIDYIDHHFMKHISIQELCDLLLVSPQHLYRIFKACVRMRPTEYINMVRIEKAKQILISDSHSIETVAGWCGFENCNYFCKQFKQMVHMTPKQYRLANGITGLSR